MNKYFVLPNSPLLTKKSNNVSLSRIPSNETQKIIQKMLKVASGQQKERSKPILVGLAAPQIGILKRIILVDVKANGKGKAGNLRIYINPEIVWISKKQGEWYEGCYSTSKVCGIVSRPLSIKVDAFTQTSFPHPKWERRVEKYTGYVARIFQHEIDHLNGKVFVDHITNPDKLHWVRRSELSVYRNKQAWRNWSKKCSFEKWQKLKKPLLNGI